MTGAALQRRVVLVRSYHAYGSTLLAIGLALTAGDNRGVPLTTEATRGLQEVYSLGHSHNGACCVRDVVKPV